jgi:hypothetical protein
MNITTLLAEKKIYAYDVDKFNIDYNSRQLEVYSISPLYRGVIKYNGKEHQLSHIAIDEQFHFIGVAFNLPKSFIINLNDIQFYKYE